MIHVESKLFVADNSGAKLVLCLKILGFSLKKFATIGDLIKVSIKKCLPKSKVKKGNIFNAVIVRTKKNIKKFNGVGTKFSDNAVVILNVKLEPLGTRIIGPVSKDLRNSKFFNLTSLSSDVL